MAVHSYFDLSPLSRRKFLYHILLAGGAAAATSLISACNAGSTAATAEATAGVQPSTTPTPAADLLARLRGLDFDTFIDESFRTWVLRDPEMMTIGGLAGYCGMRNDQLTDLTDEFIRQTQALEAGILELLNGFDTNTLTPDQAITTLIYGWAFDDCVRQQPFVYHDYPVNPMVNCISYNIFALFTDLHPLSTRQDAEDYLACFSQLATKWDQLLVSLGYREELGVVLPRRVMPDAIQSLRDVITGSRDDVIYTYVFEDRISQIPELTGEDIDTMVSQMQTTAAESVVPAYQRLIDHFTSLQATAPTDIGVWQFPNGLEYYAQCLRRNTTTELTAEEIHNLGLENAERVAAEMRAEFDALGYPADDDMQTSMNRLYEDGGDVSGAAAVAAFQDAIDVGYSYLERTFDLIPTTPVEVIGGEQGNFLSPAPLDGSRPGYFYAATSWTIPRYNIASIAFHETYPGHHLQLALCNELDIPVARKFFGFTGFVEGWALYAERLMWELGVYENNPIGNLGRLNMELLRAVRLVADTGMHALQWTWDQVSEYQTQVLGYPTERERYMVMPGQATSYYIGFLKILELRQRTMDALGANFDLKAFHRVVLQNGSVPLSVLEQLVDSYIQSQA
ncbi:MAG TPA: DUF885 domain-containing protein [Longilinea sp.]|nr:DUF885 domain-containing protein [Longilinea sp.]